MIKRWRLVIEITDDGDNGEEKGIAYLTQEELADELDCFDLPPGMRLSIKDISEIKE